MFEKSLLSFPFCQLKHCHTCHLQHLDVINSFAFDSCHLQHLDVINSSAFDSSTRVKFRLAAKHVENL